MQHQVALTALENARAQMIEKYNRDLAEMDSVISQLRADGDEARIPQPIPVHAGQYKGMSLAPALETYVRERGGGPLEITQAVKDLDLAGAILGKTKERYERNVRITISNSRALRYGDRGKKTVEIADRMR